MRNDAQCPLVVARCPSRRRRHAFTLVELLVVIAIIALLVSILLPSLASARDTAKTSQCASALRQLAIASLAHAADRRGALSTGPFDNRRPFGNGAIDQVGWVADYVRGGYCLPGQLLCPTSPTQSSQNLSLPRMNSDGHRPFTQSDVEELIDQGYNTNYCQSWLMGHTATRSPSPAGSPDPKRVAQTVGPLNEKHLGTTGPSSKVPLFGDATAYPAEDIVLYRGQRLGGGKALTDGPAIARVPSAGGIVWGRQNYTDFGPVHGKGSHIAALGHNRVYGQIAFADGHVNGFMDTTRDGEFGGRSGTRPDGITTETYDEIEGQVYGGWLTRNGLNF